MATEMQQNPSVANNLQQNPSHNNSQQTIETGIPLGVTNSQQQNPSPTNSQETDGVPIDVHFKHRFCLLKVLGIWLGTRKEDGSYTFSTGKMLTSYIAWYFVPMLTFINAQLMHRLQEEAGQDDEHIHEWLTSPMFVTLCILFPCIGSESLRTITNTLKKHMGEIPTYIGMLPKKSTRHTAELEENTLCKKLKEGAWLTSGFSTITYVVYWIGNLMDAHEDTRKRLLEEIPVFMVDIIYQILPFIITILIISFLDYFTLLYKNLATELSNLEQECTHEILEDLMGQIYKIQKSFKHMYEGFLKYAVTANILIIVYFAVLTAFHLSSRAEDVIYIIPGIIGAAQIILLARFSSILTYEGGQATSTAREVFATLQGMNSRLAQSIGAIHTLLKESPPVVRSYCNIPIGYGLIPVVGVFVWAYTRLLKAADDEEGVWKANRNGTFTLESIMPDFQQLF